MLNWLQLILIWGDPYYTKWLMNILNCSEVIKQQQKFFFNFFFDVNVFVQFFLCQYNGSFSQLWVWLLIFTMQLKLCFYANMAKNLFQFFFSNKKLLIPKKCFLFSLFLLFPKKKTIWEFYMYIGVNYVFLYLSNWGKVLTRESFIRFVWK